MINILNKKSIATIGSYTVVSLVIIGLSLLQTRAPSEAGSLFLLIYVMIFYAIVELDGRPLSIFAVSLSVVLLILSGFTLLAFLNCLLILFYFLVKAFRKKRLEAASAREKYFRTLVNLSLQPMILKNQKGEVLFTSDSLRELISPKANLVGKSIHEYIHPEDVAGYENFLSEIRELPFEKKSIEFRLRKNDDWIWVRNDAINLLGHKSIKAIVSSLSDITFQKNIDKQKSELLNNEKVARAVAEKAVRDRDEFLSIASHELKTPLTTVMLQLQATLRKILTQSLADFSGKDLLDSLQIAERQSQNLSTLIIDLLNVSMASTGRLTLNKEKVNLSEITRDLHKKYSEEIKLSDCSVHTVIKDEELIGSWDSVRIEQAISNLLMNALKYAKGKKVTLTARRHNNFAVLDVHDEGIGIEPSMQHEIFKPFKRANSGTKGLGVGLFIARQIALAHGGDISIASKVGKGSTFSLFLPL